MRVHKDNGRGWEDLGGTGDPMVLPADTRMPFRAMGIRDYTNDPYSSIDSLNCYIDNRPSEIAQFPEDDHLDRSRHTGLMHEVRGHPYTHADRFQPSYGLLDKQEWVPAKGGTWRPIRIMEITLPHNCENHLPAGDR